MSQGARQWARGCGPSVEQVPIQAAVLDGLEEVGRFDAIGSRKVGDGAGDFENAVVGTGGERELLHRLLEEVAEGRVDHAGGADLRVSHAGVGRGARAGEASELAFARGLHAGADDLGGFGGLLGAKFVDGKRGSFDVEIDAVKERPADARAVALDLRGRATALVAWVAEIAAGARILVV